MTELQVPIRIKRGVGGAPSTLLRGELAYYEGANRLYIGSGDSGTTDASGRPIATTVEELLAPAQFLSSLSDVVLASGPNDGDVLTYSVADSAWIAQAVAAASVSWADITGKPSVFTPDTHVHAWGDITSGVPSTFAPSAHKASHATGGADAIAPADIGAAAASHTHSASDITSGLATVATTGAYSDLSGTPTLGTAAASATTDFIAASAASAFGLTLIDDADASAARTTLGLGSAATSASGDFAAASHDHGNITNAGRIGSTSGLPIKTGASGVLEAGAFGTSAGQFAEGNHTHVANDITNIADVAKTGDYSSLLNIPSTFAPSAHNHTIKQEISGFIESPEAKTYVLSPSTHAAMTIIQLKAQTSAGTVDVKIQDDGADVTGATLADAGTTLASLASDISVAVAAGSKLTLVVSDPQSSPADLAFTVHYTIASENNA